MGINYFHVTCKLNLRKSIDEIKIDCRDCNKSSSKRNTHDDKALKLTGNHHYYFYENCTVAGMMHINACNELSIGKQIVDYWHDVY